MKLKLTELFSDKNSSIEINDNSSLYNSLSELYFKMGREFGFNEFFKDKLFVNSNDKIVSYRNEGLIEPLRRGEIITIKLGDNASHPEFKVKIELIEE